jgi:hypothetical protein
MSNNNFSDRLISLEQDNPSFRERYEKEIKRMLEKTLTPIQRFAFGFTAVICAGFAVFFAYIGLVTARELPVLIRAGFGLGVLFGVAWAVIGGKIALRGKMNRRTQPNALNGMAWAFVVLMQTIYLLAGGAHPDRVVSVFMVLFGLTFMLGGAVFLLTNRIEQSELNMKEKLLGIELRLAEIAEDLPRTRE